MDVVINDEFEQDPKAAQVAEGHPFDRLVGFMGWVTAELTTSSVRPRSQSIFESIKELHSRLESPTEAMDALTGLLEPYMVRRASSPIEACVLTTCVRAA